MTGPIIYPPQPVSYEQYMSEEPVKRRYDIINGVRVFAVPPSIRHQGILGNVLSQLSDYADQHDAIVLYSLFDVLISNSPFHTRQPDILLISKYRWQQHGRDDGRPLTVAPELVVEILSSPDRELSIDAKITDYCSIDVREVWVVRSEEQSVEVLRLSADEIEGISISERGQSVASVTFDGLTVAVDSIFAV